MCWRCSAAACETQTEADMTYWDRVLAKLDVPGLLLAVLGAALVYGSGKLAAKWFPDGPQKANIVLKAVGLATALLGALRLLDLIG